MNVIPKSDGNVRDDYVPKEAYVSRRFLELEKRKLWTRVWQVACREEEIPNSGDYVSYDIHDNSYIVVRTNEGQIKAYHNVCMHRGRRLVAGAGNVRLFHCNYHAWRWNLDGSVNRVLEREDWQGCPNVADDDFRLREVKADRWGGFIYINPDPECDSLAEYLAPMPQYIDPFEFENLRYRWYVSVKLPCNWKVALEAFNEGYHVAGTHPQLLATMGDDLTRSFVFGKHGMFNYSTATRPWGAPSPRTGRPVPDDLRPGIVRFMDEMNTTLHAIYTERSTEAARRLMTEVEPSADITELLPKLIQFQKEAALAAGAGWPALSLEQWGKAGCDWHVFPNQIFLMHHDGALCYRARPNGDDPDSCIYDIWSLQRYAPGAEQPLQRQYFYGDDDWKNFSKISVILQQDFNNMEQVQKGMKSDAFVAARPNPKQETSISNLHRHINRYINQ